MPGPARAGALIYAKNLEHISEFYEKLLLMKRLIADATHHVLESSDFQLIIHAIPEDIASTITIEVPPEPREQTAIKLFFTVESLAIATTLAQELGGQILDQEWLGPGFKVRNGYDPEGNIFQVREEN